MSPGPDDDASGGRLDQADRVLLLAMRAWAPAGRGEHAAGGSAEGDPRSRILDRLEPTWAQRLRQGGAPGRADPTGAPVDRAAARARLRQAQRAEARVDPARIHSSWWARGLQDESPSVRRAVVATAPEPIRCAVQASLLLDNDDLRSDRPADPEVLAWACSLWTERLVGGEPDPAGDPSVIVAMSGLSLRTGYRLCRYAGELKQALAGGSPAKGIEEFAASAGPEFIAMARHDVEATPTAKLPPRRLAARIGLLTIARLLSDCEPFRVRWALQHWPYMFAKLVRSLMPSAAKRTQVVMHVESEILKTACERLKLNGRVTLARPVGDCRTSGATSVEPRNALDH